MDRVAGSLNERYNDLTHLQIEADPGELTPLEERVKRDTVNMLREAESYSVPGHYIDGSRRLLDQPEFSQGSRARELVEEQVLLEGIISETSPDGDVVVYIGGENRQESLPPFGVIFCQYGIPSQASGTICVIGHAGALWAADNYVIPGSEHWQQSKFEAWPGDWGYECSHGGDPPGPLDCVCFADRYLLP